jgi:peptide methionine sulfoxide reductase MsrB
MTHRKPPEAVAALAPGQYRIARQGGTERGGTGTIRTAVRSRHGDSHPGPVVADGPRDRGGLRHRIDPASPRSVRREAMEAEGHGGCLPQGEGA